MKEMKFLLLLVLIISVSIASAYIGMRPARVEFDFKPGEEMAINYYVDTTPDVRMRIAAEGDMNESVTFSKAELQGSGGFEARIKMPNEAKKPGPNDLFIFVKQVVDESGGIGTAISLGALVRINVPYPGKYLEVSLSADNANKGEPVKINLHTVSRGREAVTFTPKLEIYSNNDSIDSFYLSEGVALQPTETRDFNLNLNTQNYIPGEYRAIATIDYGGDKPAISETQFRIGYLNIGVVNYTRKIIAGKINPFYVEIQSDWKSAIDGVYANVTLANGKSFLNFLTPPVTVSGFQKYTLSGFADASALDAGFYNSTVTVNYQGLSTTAEGQVEVSSAISRTVVISAAAFLGLIVIIVLSLYFYRRGRNSDKRK